MHGKRPGKVRHARVSLAVVGSATIAAAFVAANAVPAFANGSHGQSAAHSQSASHSQSSLHRKNGTAPNGKSAAHSQSGSHRQNTSHSSTSSHGKSGSHGSSGSHGNSANAHEHVTICHATPPDTAAGGYVQISPSAAGVYNGHLKEHSADIIPPFTYSGQTYSLNWDATGQAIWNNGCAVSSSTSGGTNGASHGKDNGKGKGHGKGAGKGQGGSQGNSANAHQHVTICHATPPDTAANGYVMISPSASGVFHGHLRQHAADIIPPFTYSGQTYSLNWDDTGQAIFNNGCVAPTTGSAGGEKHSGKASKHSSKANEAKLAAAAKAAFKAIIAALKPTSTKTTGGVLAAHKTLKRVTHNTRAARAVTRNASFTG